MVFKSVSGKLCYLLLIILLLNCVMLFLVMFSLTKCILTGQFACLSAKLMYVILSLQEITSVEAAFYVTDKHSKRGINVVFVFQDHAYPADELMPLTCRGRVRGLEPSRGDIDDALGK